MKKFLKPFIKGNFMEIKEVEIPQPPIKKKVLILSKDEIETAITEYLYSIGLASEKITFKIKTTKDVDEWGMNPATIHSLDSAEIEVRGDINEVC